ncbi:hypothetical protein [Parvularcula marina]|uniref:hypothetical protein n=1 Tax=Parvularcula marina TaxID=2292771 RepID=UPI003515F431
MDLLKTLRSKIEGLPEGDHQEGLIAVLLHIETAFQHLERGESSLEHSAFTDAVYRTNQAFEGTIKETYRVLTGKDASRITPYEIEQHLEKEGIFRNRVLAQFKNYRTEWRNPSAHNHKLDFESSEAVLAILSISAFAYLCIEEIYQRLSYLNAESDVSSSNTGDALEIHLNPMEAISDIIIQFWQKNILHSSNHERVLENEIIGALHGFISKIAPDIKVQTDTRLNNDDHLRADLLLETHGQQVVVEIRRGRSDTDEGYGLISLRRLLNIGGINNGILFHAPLERLDLQKRSIELPPSESHNHIILINSYK